MRINDRGPYGNDRVISLSRASADRLNTSNNTKVRIDPIIVAPDGSRFLARGWPVPPSPNRLTPCPPVRIWTVGTPLA
ncbi:hypothetical protein LNQ03_04190 [Klebsiella pneumoniae subsp. pneumoniae]|nr:hypothetical protein [Klebsiella pneumoniae subsp. pneumoniae]